MTVNEGIVNEETVGNGTTTQDADLLHRALHSRVVITTAAAAVLAKIKADIGEVMFHQSGGCCEGSGPVCFAKGRFQVAAVDRLIGVVGDGVAADSGTQVWISGRQFVAWEHTQVIIDVMEDPGAGGFSLEADYGYQFMSRARVFTDEEVAALPDAPTKREVDAGAPMPALLEPVDLTGDFGAVCDLPY